MQDAFGVERSDISKAAPIKRVPTGSGWEEVARNIQQSRKNRNAAVTSAARAGTIRDPGKPTRVMGSKKLAAQRYRNAAGVERNMQAMRNTQGGTWLDTLSRAGRKNAKDWTYVTAPKGTGRANWKTTKNALKANARKSQGPTTPSPF